MNNLSLAALKEVRTTFSCNPETGEIFRNFKPVKMKPTRKGYQRVGFRFNKRFYTLYAHRLIWFLVYGQVPKMEIDHIDGDKLNNSIRNLRDVNKTINQSNRKPNKKSSSSYKGVYFYKNMWVSSIQINKKRTYLGSFNSEIKAAEAYDNFAKLHDSYRKVNHKHD